MKLHSKAAEVAAKTKEEWVAELRKATGGDIEQLQDFCNEHEAEILGVGDESPDAMLAFDEAVSELFNEECAVYIAHGGLYVERY